MKLPNLRLYTTQATLGAIVGALGLLTVALAGVLYALTSRRTRS